MYDDPNAEPAEAGFTIIEFVVAGTMFVVAALGFVGTIFTAQVSVRATREVERANSAMVSIVEGLRRECAVDFVAAMSSHAGFTRFKIVSSTNATGTTHVNRAVKTTRHLVDASDVDTILVNDRDTYTAQTNTVVSTKRVAGDTVTRTGDDSGAVDYDAILRIGEDARADLTILQDETSISPPVDLNGDGDVLDTYVPAADMQAAVVRIKTSWRGVIGQRTLEYTTIIARGEF